jgi:hypothetical protein
VGNTFTKSLYLPRIKSAHTNGLVKMIQQTAHQWAVHNFRSGCEVGDMILQRIDFPPAVGRSVRDALRFTFERWNGNGFPSHARGEAIPLAMCIVHRRTCYEGLELCPLTFLSAAGYSVTVRCSRSERLTVSVAAKV